MSQFDPNGWKHLTCNFCGAGMRGQVFASICIHTGNKDNSEYPFTQTNLCRRCYKKHGIEAALDHNQSIRICAGLPRLKK